MTPSTDPESDLPDIESTNSDQTSTARYRVAVFAVPDVRETLMPVLVLIPRIATIDARIRLHELPGVLPEHLDSETADLLVKKFHSVGVEAARFPAAELPAMEHQATIHHVRCDSCGLELVGIGGATETVLPWADLALVSIGVVPADHSIHAIPAAAGARGVESELGAAHGPEMWLVREGPFQAWRIDHLEMNYEYLGDRMSTSAAENFRFFTQDLADHARAAYLTPSARAFLETQRVEDYRFESRASHAKAVQLHVLLRRTMQRNSGETVRGSRPSQWLPSC